MSVAFQAKGTADSTANGVTSIDHALLTIASGSQLALVVPIQWGGAVSAVSLKWDNTGTPQSMSLIPGATATNTVQSDIWGLVNPTVGNLTLHAQWTTARDVCLIGTSWTGVAQAGGASSFPNGASVTGNTTSPESITVTSAVGNQTVAGIAVADSISVNTQTSLYADTSPSTMSAAASRETSAVGAATVNHSFTGNGAAAWAIAGTDISVVTGPTITVQPQTTTVSTGQTANFSVTATSSGGALSYQWTKNGSNDGTNSSSYSITATDADNLDIIQVTVTDSNGSTTSIAVYLIVVEMEGVWPYTA